MHRLATSGELHPTFKRRDDPSAHTKAYVACSSGTIRSTVQIIALRTKFPLFRKNICQSRFLRLSSYFTQSIAGRYLVASARFAMVPQPFATVALGFIRASFLGCSHQHNQQIIGNIRHALRLVYCKVLEGVHWTLKPPLPLSSSSALNIHAHWDHHSQ